MADVFGVLFFYPIRGVQCLNDTEERTIEPRQSRRGHFAQGPTRQTMVVVLEWPGPVYYGYSFLPQHQPS